MEREALKLINNTRQRFYAVFERFGTKNSYGYTKRTLLFKDIKNSKGEVVADHLWFTDCLLWQKLSLSEGEEVGFDARVKTYIKGYRGRREDVYNPIRKDYKLSHPTNAFKRDSKSTLNIFDNSNQ